MITRDDERGRPAVLAPAFGYARTWDSEIISEILTLGGGGGWVARDFLSGWRCLLVSEVLGVSSVRAFGISGV